MSCTDLRHALRLLRRRPVFTVTATLVLALGLAATVSVFTLLDVLVLRPLPLREPERLIAIGTRPPSDAQWTSQTVQPRLVDEWRAGSRAFEDMAGFVARRLVWSGPAGPEQVDGAAVVGDLFGVFGARMTLGRPLAEGERDAAVLSHRFWQQRFGAREDVIGQPIVLDGASYTVVGVLPPETALPNVGGLPSAWLAMPAGAARPTELVRLFGRLRPGASLAAAEAELAAMQRAVQAELGDMSRARGVVLQPVQDTRGGVAGPTLAALFGGAVVLLLVACANVGLLSLAQLAGRRRELAVRSSIGATRFRLMRQGAAEHLVLWSIGGTLGVVLAAAALRVLAARNVFPAVPAEAFSADGRVLLFACAVTLGSAVLFGLVPALRMGSVDPAGVIREEAATVSGSRAARRLPRLLVGLQIALSTLLASSACLLAASLFNLTGQPLGFRADGLLTFRVLLPQRDYADHESKVRFHSALLDSLRELPGVEAAATTSARPLATIGVGPLTVEGADHEGDEPWAGVQTVDAEYFDTAGIPLVAGRALEERDARGGEPVAIVNEMFARRYFPGQDPLGRRIKFGAPGGTAPWLRIVGVVGDVKHAGLDWDYLPEIFVPYGALADPLFAFLHADIFAVLRTGSAPPTEAVLRSVVGTLDPDLPLLELMSGEQIVQRSAERARLQAAVMSAVALLAVLLAAVGLCGVVAQTVAQRRMELGIRAALGATRSRVFWTVCRPALLTAAAGAGCGALLTYVLAREHQGLLYEVDTGDPTIPLSVALAMLAIAAAAVAVPAGRAAASDPARVARAE